MPARPTIFTLSSGRRPAAIAVIRISGPRAGEALKALAGKIPGSRGLRYRAWKMAGGTRLTDRLAGIPENGGNKPA